MLETPTRLDFGRDCARPDGRRAFSADGGGCPRALRGSTRHRRAAALGTHARSLRDLGELQHAADLSREALALARQIGGPDAEPSLLAERLLASCLKGQGQRTAARDMLLDLTRRGKPALGGSHPTYLLLCMDLAMLYAENLQSQALDWIEPMVQHYATALPEDHPDRRLITNRIGWVYCMMGQHEMGLRYFEETLALRRKYDGRLAHATLRVQHANLAWALTSLGRHDEAIEHQREALALFQEKYPAKPGRWLYPQAYLVYRYARAGRFDEAIDTARVYFETSRISHENPEDHYSWTIWDLYSELIRANHPADANALAREYVACLEDVLGLEDLTVDQIRFRYLQAASYRRDVEQAVASVVDRVGRRFRMQRLLLGDQHEDVARARRCAVAGSGDQFRRS